MAVKFCPSCGKQLNEDAKFCDKCGFNFKKEEPKKFMEEAQRRGKKKSHVGKVVVGIISVLALLALIIVYIIPNYFPEYTLDYFSKDLPIAGTYFDEYESVNLEIDEEGSATILLGDAINQGSDMEMSWTFQLEEFDESILDYDLETLRDAFGSEDRTNTINLDRNSEYLLYQSDTKSVQAMEIRIPTSSLDGNTPGSDFTSFFETFSFDRKIEDGFAVYSGTFRPVDIQLEDMSDLTSVLLHPFMFLYQDGEIEYFIKATGLQPIGLFQ